MAKKTDKSNEENELESKVKEAQVAEAEETETLEVPEDEPQATKAGLEIPEDEEEQRLSREEKKRERGRLREEADANRRRAEEAEARAAKLMEAMASRLSQGFQPAATQEDPLDAEDKRLFARKKEIARLAAIGQLDDATMQKLHDEVYDIDRRAREIAAERVYRKQGPAYDPQKVAMETQRAMMAAKFPEVFAQSTEGERIRYKVQAVYNDMLAGGATDSPALFEEACSKALTALGKRRPPPTEREKSRYMGVSRNAGAGAAEERLTLNVSPKVAQKMADSAFAHIKDPKARMNQWLKTAGRKMALEQRAKRG